jgi:UDP-N-acetylmuramoylalanine--D-glutamate ligase
VDRRKPPLSDAIARGVPVVGDIEIFARAVSDSAKQSGRSRANILAVTGSNGKSTVTSMTGEACRAAGRNVIVAGNIGLPVLEALTEIESGAAMPDVFALELSSFQLESTESLAADAATVLNVTEDHLDRYDGMTAYAAAKARIFDGVGVQVLNRQDEWSLGMARPECREVTFGLDAPPHENDWGMIERAFLAHGRVSLMPASDLPVAGLHNAANALAALALGDSIGIPTKPMLEGLRRYRGLPHRLENVANIRGVTFYDDSKGTNVGATVAALNGMTAPVVLIAGGDGKGQDFAPLAAAVAAHARAVVLIGRDAPAIAAVLAPRGVKLLRCATMHDAVEAAFRAAGPGDAVLLSPACASYDMFRSYVHRGEAFVQAVHALAGLHGDAHGH